MTERKQRKWKFVLQDETQVASVVEQFKIPSILARIILNRGISSPIEQQEFLNPSLKMIQTGCCHEQASLGTTRVIEAIKNGEKMVVFGDYDADGVTGTVLLMDALRYFNANVSYYVPLRYTEGYGMNMDAVERFHQEGVRLIITVDCGISNFDEIVRANELGMDVIITDHHTPPAQLPPAIAIINPKLDGESHSTNLAGVGVAYKFVQALFLDYKGLDIVRQQKYLELVAIGTITDVVPLLGENRVFVKEGLHKLNQQTSLGLFYLLEKIRNNQTINSYTIGFGIGPRINAAGRLDSANVGIELLMTRNKSEAKRLSEKLNHLNDQRRLEGEKIFKEARELIIGDQEHLDNKVIVLSSAKWEPGVIGIVASQLSKVYERPVVLISTKGDIARGSIRSFAGIDIFSSLEESSQFLQNYGGHPEAAGFEIDPEKIASFREQYVHRIELQLKDQILISEIEIDAELSFADIKMELVQQLKRLEPYGEGNREPIFLTRRLNAIDYTCVGKDKQHLKVLFTRGADQIEAIGFKMSDYKPLLDEFATFDVVYNLDVNTYFGESFVQMKMIDLKPVESSL